MDFTVAICTFNGAKRLPNVLDRLQEQVSTDFLWEIILIDNASTDDTATIIRSYQDGWRLSAPLRYCVEPKQGLTYARRCAFEAAKSGIIGFLDDDNWPDSQWVSNAYSFSCKYPKAGAYGSYIYPIFESEPPPGFDRISFYFALRTEEAVYCYNDRYRYQFRKLFPPGAGIVIRKSAWLDSVPQEQAIVGVKGASLSTKSEDVELLSYLFYKGYQIWHNPMMKIGHYIPHDRLQVDYLKRFFQGIGYSRYITRMQAYGKFHQLFLIPFYLIIDIVKIVNFYLKNYRLINSDIVITAEWQLLRSIPLGIVLYLKKLAGSPYNRGKYVHR
jgi:glycosyltransferase involved in cell wall biosynthesis